MRTTLNLDNDVLEHARQLADNLKQPFRFVINEALRSGLKEMEAPLRHRPYQTQAHDMELRPGLSLDSTSQLLADVEGEDYR